MVADQTGSVSKQQRYLPFLVLLFIGSGCAALIYEIVWFQILELVIGASSISLGILLGTFMGGMCVGSLLAPRFVSRVHHPLRVYAYLELGIAVLGLIILFAVPLIGGLYTAFAGSGMGSMLFRGILAGICLLPPDLPYGCDTARDLPLGGNLAGGCFLAGVLLWRKHSRCRCRKPARGFLPVAGL